MDLDRVWTHKRGCNGNHAYHYITEDTIMYLHSMIFTPFWWRHMNIHCFCYTSRPACVLMSILELRQWISKRVTHTTFGRTRKFLSKINICRLLIFLASPIYVCWNKYLQIEYFCYVYINIILLIILQLQVLWKHLHGSWSQIPAKRTWDSNLKMTTTASFHIIYIWSFTCHFIRRYVVPISEKESLKEYK